MPRRTELRPSVPRPNLLEQLQETHVHVSAGEFRKPMREAIQEFVLAGGVQGAAATAAKRCEDQLNISTEDNQDRVVVGNDIVAVVDGFGGGQNGRDAAQVLAEELLRLSPGVPFDRAIESAITQYNANPDKFQEDDGACFAACRVIEKTADGQFVEMAHLGDCRVIVLDAAGTVIEESEDDSLVNRRVKKGELSESDALVSQQRNIVSRYVAAPYQGTKITPRMRFVPSGGRVILVTDGVMDNFSTAELAREVHGKTAREAIVHIDTIIDARVQWFEKWKKEYSGNPRIIISRLIEEQWETADPVTGKSADCFPDGFQALPKRDDRGMVIVDF